MFLKLSIPDWVIYLNTEVHSAHTWKTWGPRHDTNICLESGVGPLTGHDLPGDVRGWGGASISKKGSFYNKLPPTHRAPLIHPEGRAPGTQSITSLAGSTSQHSLTGDQVPNTGLLQGTYPNHSNISHSVLALTRSFSQGLLGYTVLLSALATQIETWLNGSMNFSYMLCRDFQNAL